MAHRAELESCLNALLDAGRFKDYGPNGLQVEGRDEVRRLVSGVTASRAFIEAAIERGADALLVHHGLFWCGMDGRVTGWLKRRLELLLAHGISLYAYHLPLDAHAEFGNNAQLGLQLGLLADGRFGEQSLGFVGAADEPLTATALASRIAGRLRRPPVVVAGDGRLSRIAWCTGGAQGYFESAIAAGAHPTSPAKFPSRRRTWRARPVWPTSPAATTPANVSARRRWPRMWRRASASSMSSSTSTTRPEAPGGRAGRPVQISTSSLGTISSKQASAASPRSRPSVPISSISKE